MPRDSLREPILSRCNAYNDKKASDKSLSRATRRYDVCQSCTRVLPLTLTNLTLHPVLLMRASTSQTVRGGIL
jgi:hypothetical protein